MEKDSLYQHSANLIRRFRHAALIELPETKSFVFNRPMIPETSTDLVPDDKIRKLLLCSGKVYYDLHERRKQLDDKTVAIVRVEQLHPFPWTLMAQTIAKYSNAEVCWVQEGKKIRSSFSFQIRSM
jgi:2-oxoglutarate dehydrogenase E1 component